MEPTESEKTVRINKEIKIDNFVKGIIMEHRHKKLSKKTQESTPLHKDTQMGK